MQDNRIYINTNRNAIGIQLLNSNKNTIKNQIYIYTQKNAKGIELQDLKDNTITVNSTNNIKQYCIWNNSKRKPNFKK